MQHLNPKPPAWIQLLGGEYTPMATILKPGNIGSAKIEVFEVTPAEAERSASRALFRGRDAYVPAGVYCRLFVNGQLMMSDTPMEQRTNRDFVRKARGDVLIAGLGLGMVLVPVLANPEVTSVTVIEKSADVIALVVDKLKALPGGEKLTVIEADIYEWQPPKGQTWDVLYFDIWGDFSGNDLQHMTRLHRRFGKRRRKEGWMNSWQCDTLRAQQRRGR